MKKYDFINMRINGNIKENSEKILNKNNDNKENKYKTVNNIEMENYKYNYHVIKKS